MQKIYVILLGSILTSLCNAVVGAKAQSFDQIPVSTSVQPVGSDTELARVDLNTHNKSHKTITAVKWFVEGRYSDGSVKTSELGVDWVSDLMIIDRQDRSFRPGTNRIAAAFLPLGMHGEMPVITQARLTAIVFSDNTGIGEPEKIWKIGDTRKSIARDKTEELDEIDKAFSSSSPKDALRSALNAREAKKKLTSGTLTQVLGLLENGIPIESVKSVVAILARFRDILVQHSNLEAK